MKTGTAQGEKFKGTCNCTDLELIEDSTAQGQGESSLKTGTVQREGRSSKGHAQSWSLLRTGLLKVKGKLTEDGDSSKKREKFNGIATRNLDCSLGKG